MCRMCIERVGDNASQSQRCSGVASSSDHTHFSMLHAEKWVWPEDEASSGVWIHTLNTDSDYLSLEYALSFSGCGG